MSEIYSKFSEFYADAIINKIKEMGSLNNQILSLRCENKDLASSIVLKILEMLDYENVDIGIDGANRTPIIRISDNLIVIQACSNDFHFCSERNHECTLNYASTLRNHITDRNLNQLGYSLLILTERSIDTLKAAMDLNRMGLSFDDLVNQLINVDYSHGVENPVIIKGISEYIRTYVSEPDLNECEKICGIFSLLKSGMIDEVINSIADLPPGMFRVDKLLTLTPGVTSDNVFNILNNSRKEFESIASTKRIGKDPIKELRNQYHNDFLSDIRSSSFNDIKQMNYSYVQSKRIIGRPLSKKTLKIIHFDGLDLISPSNGDFFVFIKSEEIKQISIELNTDPNDVDITIQGNLYFQILADNRIDFSLTDQNDSPSFHTIILKLNKTVIHVNLCVVNGWFLDSIEKTSTLKIDSNKGLIVIEADEDGMIIKFDKTEDCEMVPVNHNDNLLIHDNTIFTIAEEIDNDNVEFFIRKESTDKPIPIRLRIEVPNVNRKQINMPTIYYSISHGCGGSSCGRIDSQSVVTDGVILIEGNKYVVSRELMEFISREVELLKDDLSLIFDTNDGLEQIKENPILCPLYTSYSRLVEHFIDRQSCPSIDEWNQDTRDMASEVVSSYNNIRERIKKENQTNQRLLIEILSKVGKTVTEGTTYLNPFHPLILSYCIRLADFRDKDLDEVSRSNGFKGINGNGDIWINHLSPSGLIPYVLSKDDWVLESFNNEINPLWIPFSASKREDNEAPTYFSRLVKEKISSFYNSNKILFSLSDEKEIIINFINMGDYKTITKGLISFYSKYEDAPPMSINIYGGSDEGHALGQVFNPSIKEGLDWLAGNHEEDIDCFIAKTRYVKKGEYRGILDFAHITFFKGLFGSKYGSNPRGKMASGILQGGLMSSKAMRSEISITNKRSYFVAYDSTDPFDDSERTLVMGCADFTNEIEYGMQQRNYLPDQYIMKVVEPRIDEHVTVENRDNFNELWEKSTWVVHVQPNVGLDYYIHKDEGSDQKIIIHYSDQYDPSSPTYDAVTSTRFTQIFQESLKQVMDEYSVEIGIENIDNALKWLVAVDGELSLALLDRDENKVKESIAMVGSMVLAYRFLSSTRSDYIWIPISVGEIVKQNRRYGSGEGLIKFSSHGAASDDILFIGVPREGDENHVVIWIVESKWGKSDIRKGIDQVAGAHDELTNLVYDRYEYADDLIVKSYIGRIVLDVAYRLRNYGILEVGDYHDMSKKRKWILDGCYDIDSFQDEGEHIGEVINIDPGRIDSQIQYPVDSNVRVLRVSPIIFNLFDSSANIREILRDFPEGIFHSFDTYKFPIKSRILHIKHSHKDIEEEIDDVSTNGDVETEPTSIDDKPSDIPQQEGMDGESNEGFDEAPEGPLTIPSLSRGDRFNDINIGEWIRKVEQGLSELGVKVKKINPDTVTIGPRSLNIDVTLQSEERIDSLRKSVLDTLALKVRAAGKISHTLDIENGVVRLVIPHGQAGKVTLGDALQNQYQGLTSKTLTFLAGIDDRNEDVIIDMVSETHMLVGGTTGSGKSTFLKSTILGLCLTNEPSKLIVSILDPKGLDFVNFMDLENVGEGRYFDTPEGCVDYILQVVERELEVRKSILRRAGVSNIDMLWSNDTNHQLAYHLIVIDEYADLMATLDKGGKEKLEQAIIRLAQVGRAMGIRLILATQRPTVDIVKGSIKANFPCRVSFKLPSSRDSITILDRPGAEDLKGRGGMILIDSKGEHFLQGYYVNPSDESEIIHFLSKQ